MRLPATVVSSLPVVHREIERRAELARSAQRPAVGRFEQRDFLGAGVNAPQEDAERVRRCLGLGRRLAACTAQKDAGNGKMS